MSDNGSPLSEIVEALIFASAEPVSASKIRSCIEGGDGLDVEAEVANLNQYYEEQGRSFRIKKAAGGFMMATLPDYEKWVRRLFTVHGRLRLSQAALETLSIIAYRQPVSKPTMEAIRGINCDGVIKTLLERNLLIIRGREHSPGRPILYGTSQEFLRYFGLNNLNDLPALKEIEEILDATGEIHED